MEISLNLLFFQKFFVYFPRDNYDHRLIHTIESLDSRYKQNIAEHRFDIMIMHTGTHVIRNDIFSNNYNVLYTDIEQKYNGKYKVFCIQIQSGSTRNMQRRPPLRMKMDILWNKAVFIYIISFWFYRNLAIAHHFFSKSGCLPFRLAFREIDMFPFIGELMYMCFLSIFIAPYMIFFFQINVM